MIYHIELQSPPRDKQRWVIKGLRDCGPFGDRVPVPDTVMWGIGVNHSCANPWSVMQALHSVLYDERQTNEQLREGDEFHIPETVARRYHDHATDAPTFIVPAMRFLCVSVHVNPDEATLQKFKEHEQKYDSEGE